MMSAAHAVTGAFIASCLPSPWLFIPLAFASHFLLDHVQHFDAGTGMRTGKQRFYTIVVLAFLDLLIAALLIAIFWRQTLPSHFTWTIWLGAFFGILPDILESTQLFFHHSFAVLQPLYHFHEYVHRSTTNVFWGILPQVILILCIGLSVMIN